LTLLVSEPNWDGKGLALPTMWPIPTVEMMVLRIDDAEED
jgi:hypothetical protein